MPNPNSINWTLFVSSSSDSASTQKLVNKLIEDCRKADEEKFGSASLETVDLVKSFCSMHLGVNLRKAFLNGVTDVTDDDPVAKYSRVDVTVHE